jgi:hypothetical protein
VIEYTLGNLWQQLVLLKQIKWWSLTCLEQRLVKLRRMEAYRCQPGRRGETNLDDGGELTRGVREGASKMEQKIASVDKCRYIGPQPKGKTEIPAKSSCSGSPVPRW